MSYSVTINLALHLIKLPLTWSHSAICRSFQREVPDVRSIFMFPRINTLPALCVLLLASWKHTTGHIKHQTFEDIFFSNMKGAGFWISIIAQWWNVSCVCLSTWACLAGKGCEGRPVLRVWVFDWWPRGLWSYAMGQSRLEVSVLAVWCWMSAWVARPGEKKQSRELPLM